MTAQRWSAHLPGGTLLEVLVGRVGELVQFDPGFPHKHDTQDQLLVLLNGVVVGRMESVQNRRLKLDATIAEGKYSSALNALPKTKHLRVLATKWRGAVEMYYSDGDVFIELEPPEGSFAARRKQEMEKSWFKRWLYPLSVGFGKAGWAIALVVAAPLIGRVRQWLAQLMPNVNLPNINLPTLPEIPFPPLPAWLDNALAHNEIWMPIVAGIALAVLAVRRKRRADKHKADKHRHIQDSQDGA